MHLEVSRRTDMALRAMGHMAANGLSSGQTIAGAIDTTPNYLPQLLKPLVVAGWVVGTPGPGGGYRLSVDLDEISVLDVVEVMEGTEQARCVLRGVPCPVPEPCALHDSWMRARDALLAELDAMPVATTLQSAPRKGD